MDTKNEKGSVLITGAAGFIGSNLVKALLEKNRDVYAMDNLITGKMSNLQPFFKNKNFHFFVMDITDPTIKKIFSGVGIKEIYHLACPTGVPNIKSMGEEMILTCSKGTLNIMEIAKLHNAKVVFSSSAEVYGQPEKSPQKELYFGNVDPVGPRSAYEEGKRFSESILRLYGEKYGLETNIVRIFNTYGPGMSLNDQRVIPRFLKSLKEKKDFTVYGDGNQTRTFLYIDDLLKGLLLIMQNGKPGEVYNLGGTDQVKIKDLAEIVLNLAKAKNRIDYRPHFIEDHKSRQPSTEKISQLGWEQTVSLQKGIVEMLEFTGLLIPEKKEEKAEKTQVRRKYSEGSLYAHP